MIKKLRQKLWSLIVYLGIANCFSDKVFVRLLYFFRLGRHLDLESPVDFNEKLQWLKIYYHNPLMCVCADKYEVRRFVAERIGEKCLNHCLGVYDKVEDIPFDELPNRFVLKATHGSGWNIVCSDKSNLLVDKITGKLRKWLKSDFSRIGREWQYGGMPHRIICESFLSDPDQPVLRDYKVFTFGGVPKCIWVDYHKKDLKGNVRRYRNFYDINWNFMNGCGSLFPNGEGRDIDKPQCLEEMLSAAESLGKDFPHCRVDFYVLDGGARLVFGEMTFTCGNGVNEFFPLSFDRQLGEYIVLPRKD